MSIATSALPACCSAALSISDRRARCVACDADWALRCIEAAARGQPGALAALAARIGPRIGAAVARHTRRGGERAFEARDLVQEVWVALLRHRLRKLRQWDPRRGAGLDHFITMVAARELATLRRRRRRSLLSLGIEEAGHDRSRVDVPTPEQLLDSRRALWRVLERVHRELPARGLAVFEGLYLDQLPPDQLAAQIGVRRQVVYNWRHRIRKLLTSDARAERGDERRPRHGQ